MSWIGRQDISLQGHQTLPAGAKPPKLEAHSLLPLSYSCVVWASPRAGPGCSRPLLGLAQFLVSWQRILKTDQPIICDILIIFTVITVNNDGCYLFHVYMLQTQC